MKPSAKSKPQKVIIEKDTSLVGISNRAWQIYSLHRFYGWSWVADVHGYALARKVAALVRKGV